MSARDDARAALNAWDDAVSDWAGHAQALADALQAVLDEQGKPEQAQSQQAWTMAHGWAAEQEPEDVEQTAFRGMWYPYIQLQGGMGADLDIHFRTEEDCLEFIRDEILGVQFFPGEEPGS